MTRICSCLIAAVLLLAFYPKFEAVAQIAKEPTALDKQNYTITENDIRTYQIFYESINKKDYATYYEAIREKIKEKLKKNYTYHYKEGDVSIFFVLNFDGSLAKIDIESANSTNDRDLVDIASRSVKQASPFPHFPKTLPLSKMAFNIKISFKAG